MTELRMIVVSAPSIEVAAALAHDLVENRLAACVQLLPGARSIYRWQGQLHDAGETLLVIKTTSQRASAVRRRLEERHPYEVPEILALAVEEGSPAYVDWVRRETSE